MSFICTDTFTLSYSVKAIRVNHYGSLVIAAGTQVILWNPETQESRTLEHTDPVTCVAVHPNGNVLAGSYKSVYVWDPESDEPSVIGHSDRVTCIAIRSDGLILSGAGSNVEVWTMASKIATLQHDGNVTSIAVIQDNRVVTAAGVVKMWDADLSEIKTKEYQNDVSIVEAFADGRVLVGSGNEVHVWDPDNKHNETFVHNSEFISSLAVLGEDLIVSGSEDGTIKVWNVDETMEEQELAPSSWASALAVLPDGRFVSGSDDGTVQIWDANTPEPVVTFGEKNFPTNTRLFTLITSRNFDPDRDLAFFGKRLTLNVRATLHHTQSLDYVYLHVFNTTGPLRLLTAPHDWRQSIYDTYMGHQELEKHLVKYCIQNNFDGWYMRVKIDNKDITLKDADYETVVLKSSYHKLKFRMKRKVRLKELKDKDHVRVTNGKIVFVKRIERLHELFGKLRF